MGIIWITNHLKLGLINLVGGESVKVDLPFSPVTNHCVGVSICISKFLNGVVVFDHS